NFVEGLDSFSAGHDGPYGKIVSEWQRSEGSITYHVSIPANSSATLYIRSGNVTTAGEDVARAPGVEKVEKTDKGLKITLKAGDYDFTVN
ncbi:MAG: hypothetical protein GT597_03250, partial [Bacteroidales bacterium]|nr:hypothetical protein [Bacteroidales bacterium]